MAHLTEPQKEAVVLLFARCRTPAEVLVAMKDAFDVDLTIQHVRIYNPAHPLFEAGEKWRPIYDAARKAYLQEVADVPVANQGFRLRLLQEGVEAAKAAKNWKMVADLMEQAAKEVGGVLTNARELNINDSRRAREMSSEDRAAALGAMISEAMADAKDKAAQPGLTKH